MKKMFWIILILLLIDIQLKAEKIGKFYYSKNSPDSSLCLNLQLFDNGKFLIYYSLELDDVLTNETVLMGSFERKNDSLFFNDELFKMRFTGLSSITDSNLYVIKIITGPIILQNSKFESKIYSNLYIDDLFLFNIKSDENKNKINHFMNQLNLEDKQKEKKIDTGQYLFKLGNNKSLNLTFYNNIFEFKYSDDIISNGHYEIKNEFVILFDSIVQIQYYLRIVDLRHLKAINLPFVGIYSDRIFIKK